MASNALTTRDADWTAMEKVIVQGDLARLSAEDRVLYYRQVCESVGLNPFTKPFDYITLNGKLTLYATRNATDQLRDRHNISVQITGREVVDDIYVVTARATLPDGRTDESIGALAIGGLKGEARANAMMKCETKAKRRVTLSAKGLSFLDETEVESVATARAVTVTEDGEIVDPRPTPLRAVDLSPPVANSMQIRRLWALAKEYYGKEEADAKLHLWLSEDYPLAIRDGKPSIRALTSEQADQCIAVLAESIAQLGAAEEPDGPPEQAHLASIASE